MKSRLLCKKWIAGVVALGLAMNLASAVSPGPPGSGHEWLEYWGFGDTNTWNSELNYAPLSYTNISANALGDWNALVLDSTNAAWLRYNVYEADGTTNLAVDKGTVLFWFAPAWASTNQGGAGPGEWGRLIEVGSYTTNASAGWWSIFTDPDGVNLYFGTQTNGAGSNYITVPISWTTNYWHMLTLTYSATNTALYIDGTLATNGPGLAYWPGPQVLTNGFWIGSDSNGLAQAHGMYDDLFTYSYPLDGDSVGSFYQFYLINYYMNPLNGANLLRSGESTPTIGPVFNAVTGTGFLASTTNAVNCVTNSGVWLTNIMAMPQSNGTIRVSFTIAGGDAGAMYDVFANSILTFSSETNKVWAWMGQGYHCNDYTLTNLPGSVYLILGTPLDSDGDGLTDAYENLVSKTNPSNPDTDGDGIPDGVEVQFGTNPLSDESALGASRLNYVYDSAGWLKGITGEISESVGLDAEGNVDPH